MQTLKRATAGRTFKSVQLSSDQMINSYPFWVIIDLYWVIFIQIVFSYLKIQFDMVFKVFIRGILASNIPTNS